MQLNRNIKRKKKPCISDLQSLERKQLHVDTLGVRCVCASLFIYNIFYDVVSTKISETSTQADLSKTVK